MNETLRARDEELTKRRTARRNEDPAPQPDSDPRGPGWVALQRAIGNAGVGRLFSAPAGAAPAAEASFGAATAQGVSEAASEEARGDIYPVSADIERRIDEERPHGQALLPPLRSGLEDSFGRDFGDVRVHTGTEPDRLAVEVNADAFTAEGDVFFRAGRFAPETPAGFSLLAHELTHVAAGGPGDHQVGRQAAEPVPAPTPAPESTPAPAATPTPAVAERMEPGTSARLPGGLFYVVYQDEIRVGPDGTRAWRNNNPGNLIAGPYSRRHGSIGVDYGGMAIFPDRETGEAAQLDLLRTEKYQPMTIDAALTAYAPPNENPTEDYIQQVVAALTSSTAGVPAQATSTAGTPAATKVTRATIVRDLTAAQFDAMLGTMRVREHWQEGTTYTNDSKDIPPALRNALGHQADAATPTPSGAPATTATPAAATPTATPAAASQIKQRAVRRTAQGRVWRQAEAPLVSTTAAAPALASSTPAAPTLTPKVDLTTPAPATAAPVAALTTDALLNEWLALHADSHLASDLTWILSQWPGGGSISDLSAGFGADVQALVNFAGAAGGQFSIISYARSPQKQHVMHVGHWIRRGLVSYDAYKFSQWSGVTAAGGRAAILALTAEERQQTLKGIASPELLGIVWDTGTAADSKTAGTAISQAYKIGADNPCANGGAAYSWPTADPTESLHGGGNAVDADPVSLPNVTTITQTQASLWPDLAAVQGQFGATSVTTLAATDKTPASYTITGLSAVAQRDAFFEMFFRVRAAARATPPFVDTQHFQAP